jgi:hypothetical protein
MSVDRRITGVRAPIFATALLVFGILNLISVVAIRGFTTLAIPGRATIAFAPTLVPDRYGLFVIHLRYPGTARPIDIYSGSRLPSSGNAGYVSSQTPSLPARSGAIHRCAPDHGPCGERAPAEPFDAIFYMGVLERIAYDRNSSSTRRAICGPAEDPGTMRRGRLFTAGRRGRPASQAVPDYGRSMPQHAK